MCKLCFFWADIIDQSQESSIQQQMLYKIRQFSDSLCTPVKIYSVVNSVYKRVFKGPQPHGICSYNLWFYSYKDDADTTLFLVISLFLQEVCMC